MAKYTTSKLFFVALQKIIKKQSPGLEKFHISVRKGEKEN